jgi:signal transduction histidine kinase/response regulator RpfG family c-di-GMP phosphodiesterase
MFDDHPARVLIVDDERHNRQLLEVMLAPEGFHLLAACNGEEALAIVARQAPDLILLDVMMPGMDGYEVTARIKADPATTHIPVVIVTALEDRQARMIGLTAGAAEFLTKPVDRAELLVRVKNLLRLKAYGDYYGRYSEKLEGEVASRTADLLERTQTLEQHTTALRRSDERTTYALGAARMGLWELDLATRHLAWSATMAPLFGLAPDLAPTTADGFIALIHPDDRRVAEDALAMSSREGPDLDVEFRAVWPDGSAHWIGGRARTLRDPDDAPVRILGIGMDIADRKSLEAQFRQAQKIEAVGQLAGGIAHDFNNIMTVILGYSTMVLDGLPSDDRRHGQMEQVVKAGERAVALTGQLLAFSRKQVLQPTAVDLNALVDGMRPMLSRLIGEDVDLVSILAPDLHAVRADRGQIEQVLMNLVLNARDAMPIGGRLAVETANVALDGTFLKDGPVRPGPYVLLAVSDSGTGMSPATMERLFEPFFTTKERGHGTGLGLATVYGIVKQSGGYIWVYSEPDHGATFKVYLPRAEGEDPLDPGPVIDAAAAGGTENVLVVEDEDAVRVLTRTILEKAGYRVAVASNSQGAEALFDEDPTRFQLLVTDVIMPGLTGPELFSRLSTRRPQLRVLYVSGYTGNVILQHGPLTAAAGFLQKPFTAEALKRRVRDVLDR